MPITLTTNYEFKKNSLGHPLRDVFTAANLDMIDAAIHAGVSPLASSKIIVGNGSNVAAGVPMSGDMTIDNAGVTTIGADKVANSMLENITRGSVKVGGAADAPTDLVAKADAQILVGDATDLNSVAVTGDVTIDNAGLTAIGVDKVTKTQIAGDIAGDGLVQAAGGELDINPDDSTIELNTDALRIKDLGVTIAKLEAALLKGIVTVPLSFQTGEVSATRIYFPYKVTINKILSIVMLVVEASDDGTITGANSVGGSDAGVVTVAGGSAVDTEDDATPTSNIVVAVGSYYKLTTAKSTKGGKVLVTLEYTRTA